MKYRALDPDGDYLFGDAAVFLTDTPETVMQAIITRLRLTKGEWFLDQRVGFDTNQVLGYGTQTTRDAEVQRIILETQGVSSITSYSSSVSGRAFSVTAVVNTIYGAITLTEIL